MIGGRKVRSNKGKRRGPYKTGRTRSGAKFRGRNPTVKRKRSNNKPRKVRSNKGKKRSTYRRGSGRTRSGRKFRVGSQKNPVASCVASTDPTVKKLINLMNEGKKRESTHTDYLSLQKNWSSVPFRELESCKTLINSNSFDGSTRIAIAIFRELRERKRPAPGTGWGISHPLSTESYV